MYDTGYTPGIILGAFSGSIIFIVSAKEYPPFVKVALFFSAMSIGVLAAKWIASLVTLCLISYVDLHIPVPDALGAAFASDVAVRSLTFLANLPASYNCLMKITKEINKK